MFYSHTFLAKKTPLGTVWIAAHLERRIKKPQIDAIDIPSYAECIMFPEVPIALRLSGHLLLGLVRIYSWKVNYLFQDCNRMLTNIRMAVASIQVNIPADADETTFESVTLPETLELDAFELDDHHMEESDIHQKDYEQITLTDERSSRQDQYVTFSINEENREDLLTNSEMRSFSAGPMEEDVLPPFQDGPDVIATPVLNPQSLEDPGSNDSFPSFGVNNSALEFPAIEVMREAQDNFESANLAELDTINDLELHEHSAPLTAGKDCLSPILEDVIPRAEESLPSLSHSSAPAVAWADDSNILNRGFSLDQPLPELELQPSPPVREEKAKRIKRKQSYDQKVVLTNVEMKRLLENTTKLVHKRRKLPCTVFDLWRYQRKKLDERILHEPLFTGMCCTLRETFEKSFPLSISDSANMEGSSGFARASPRDALNDLDIEPEQQSEMEMEPQQQINLDAASEQPAQMEIEPQHQIDLDAAPEQQTEMGMEPQQQIDMDAAPEQQVEMEKEPQQQIDLDAAPERHRFVMQIEENMTDTMPSPSGVGDLTPFDTTTVGSASDIHKTFKRDILTTVESFTRDGSASFTPEVNLFSLEEEPLLDSTPNIPRGLISAEEEGFDFLHENNVSSGQQESEAGNLSARTKAVAHYFKNNSHSQTQDSEPGVFSLNNILEGKTRKQCARMFFESLVLKSSGFIDVQQDEPYGDIRILPNPALFSTKF